MNNTITQQINDINIQITQAEKTIKIYKSLAVFSILSGFILIAIFLIIFYLEKEKEYHYLIDVGNISGGIVASLFSLAGLILVYVAFLGQKQQLLYQQIEMIYNKEELSLTRNEMSNQQIEMQKQNDTLEIQRFENLLFQLIENYQNNKVSFYIVMDSNLFLKFKKKFYEFVNSCEYRDRTDEWVLQMAYNDTIVYFKTFENTFVYQINAILKFIYNSNDKIDKNLYIDIFDKTISPAEKFCLNIIYNFDQSLNIEDKEYITRSNILRNVQLPEIVRFY